MKNKNTTVLVVMGRNHEKGCCLQTRASGDDNDDGASAAGDANKGLVTVLFWLIASWQRKPCHGSRQSRSS
jgi:hypothetical protein